MDNPYHSYLFFNVLNAYYQQSEATKNKQKQTFQKLLEKQKQLHVTTYSTLGLKPNTTFMLWVQVSDPSQIQTLLRDILGTELGQWVTLTYSYFGAIRKSTYSGRTGKPEQEIRQYANRMKYLIVYPFTKTTDWYQLDFENRKSIMGQHIKTGVAHPDIRQCLLYSYGIDDYEFVVSYETQTLEEFQELIMEMRSTIGRKYTLTDTPTFTCVYKPLAELIEWL
ncbi:MAG TPA: chlorite dismutase family protein [Verrucomicrobiae bacterium]|nr:chlorite dismutase family protein [Verrucomicrobiae bacterium]